MGKNTQEALERTYCSTDSELNSAILAAIDAIGNGGDTSKLEVLVKKEPTTFVMANADHDEERYRPGSTLVTYTGVTDEGEIVQETWGGGTADLTWGTVIMSQVKSVAYPEGSEFAGKVVRGAYLGKSGEFEIDQINGSDELVNQWTTDPGYVKATYGVWPKFDEWQTRFKLDPVSALLIPESVEQVPISDFKNTPIFVSGGDYVLIGSRIVKGEVEFTDVFGHASKGMDAFYMPRDEYLAQQEEAE